MFFVSGSNLNIMYQSSQSLGYLTTIQMKLTGDEIPDSLTHVHVRVEIEGCLYVKTYEADPNLYHTFAWNKRNIYKQKVYGIATAKVSSFKLKIQEIFIFQFSVFVTLSNCS